MVLSTAAIIAMIILFLGVIAFIVGIILYELNVQNRAAQEWYVWALLIGGLIIAIVGGMWLAYAARKRPVLETERGLIVQ
jgi:hypothetical protein